MQLAISVVLIVIGVFVAVFADVAPDLHTFGWILVGVGMFGLISRWLINMARRS